MVLYYSGTGNSQLVAKQLAAETGDSLVSINRCLKTGAGENFRTERPLVFVCPTYAWRLPRLAEQWIRGTTFLGNQEAYFILTCGSGSGNAASYIQKLCAEKGLSLRGFASVLMPENYLAMFPTPGKAEAKEIIEAAKPKISALAARIRENEAFPKARTSLTGSFLSGPINPLFYRLFVSDRGFRVSEACVSCGLCARRCPLSNIIMEEGRPRWQGNCTHCMACIGGCPVRAIDYKKASVGRPRIYNMDDRDNH